ncbi:MAG: transcription antitermination factor NusB [Nocardioidaceae bacterium]|nr:transcription antitermination factor NusB [Nocardioidaceae bacterium]
MGARTKARKRALDLCFEAELRGLPLDGTLEQHVQSRQAAGEQPLNDYTVILVRGVVAHQERIDAVLAEFSVGWSLDRMPAVDRNLLRIGAYEVLLVEDVPDAVAISEAVNLARELSTDESPRFVNGVLARIEERRPSVTG